ncbi:MAG: aspartate aminotransferase family protein [Clostridiales Family XIII bacterium]|jgi:4-aminobutyrate aminotransferase/(S)-3-amino-2-methylpropionate transaminase|nr:aspartate aminotransferase family protein [Clostridiales Family XIII bacterium]
MMSLRNSLPKVNGTLPGPKGATVLERRAKYLPAAIKSAYPVVIERAEGAMIEDADGNRFLDWIGGVGVMNIGYSIPELVEAVQAQSEKYFHSMMNITTNPLYIDYIEKLAPRLPVKGEHTQVMLANSGAEADENAIKVAKAATGRPNIIVFTGAFHGRTSLTMTMTAKKAYSHGMGPFPDGVYRAEYPYLYRAPGNLEGDAAVEYYIEKLKQVFDNASPAEHVAAIVFEPVQGEGGFVPAPFAWVKAVREICDEKGIMLIADEVQTGFARSGRLFASEYYKENGYPVDIITFAKSVAGGIPLSGLGADKALFDKVPGGTIGGTYNGNALACASALKVLEVMDRDDYPGRALALSDRYISQFNEWKKDIPEIGDVRGLGAMMGVEFVKDDKKTPNPELVGKIVSTALANGLLLESAGTYGNVIRFLCPLCVTDEQFEKGLEIYYNAIKANI